jgi:hypothetical protein
MGFLKPELPELDIEEWNKGSRSEKIRPMAKHWAEVGFGTPVVMHLFYVGKILLYILFAWLLAVPTTRGLAFTNVMSWYSEPIVFEKGRALHHVVRGDRARLRLRAAEQPVQPSDGVDLVLAAA